LGCYRDQVPRYLTVYIPTRPATVGACVDMCNAQGYSIAALRNTDLCFCGNAYNKGYQVSKGLKRGEGTEFRMDVQLTFVLKPPKRFME